MANAFNRKFRRPVHVGTRSFTDNEEGFKAIIAIPLLQGETLERIALDCLGVTRSEEANFDQPPVFSWVAGFTPLPLGTIGTGGTPLSVTNLDLHVRNMVANAATYLGGEPNPGGDTAYQGADDMGVGPVTTFKRNVIGDPVPVGKDTLDNTDARFIDRFRTSIERPFKAVTHGVYLVGAVSWRMDAETSFGVEVMDNSASLSEIHAALTDFTSSVAATAELLWGGDNYIEADSFKETSRRQFVIARPAIRLAPRYQP